MLSSIANGRALAALALFLASTSASLWAQGQPRLLEVQLAGRIESGLPIHWDREYGLLLKPSGSMLELEITDVHSHRILEDVFVPQSLSAARGALQSELGSNYETATIGPYVLAAQRGHVHRWRERFRVLLAGYSRYFETRGWNLRAPDFPLCVIVLPSKADFDRYCQSQLGKSMPSLMGYYFPKTNRCVLFEVGGGTQTTDWSETERTIVHEAVHQLAYNTGVHERLADNPQWIVEGLATMFEEPSVFDARVSSQSIASRVNPQQLQHLRGLLAQPAALESQLAGLVESNDLFKGDAQTAYALSWGLTFYLTERMSSQFGSYTQRLARLEKLRAYNAGERAKDFSRAFEADVRMIALQMQRFFGGL